MRYIYLFLIALLTAILASGCVPAGPTEPARPATPVNEPDHCPPAGTRVPFAKLMNPGFADDYVGCDVVTTAQFVASGQGNFVLQMPLKGKVVFRCLPAGAMGQKNPLSGEIDSDFVVIPKDISDLVFELKPGDMLELRGGNNVYTAVLGGSYKEIVFDATSMKRIQHK